MGKSDVKFDDDILEINEHAQAIAEAANRKQRSGSPAVRGVIPVSEEANGNVPAISAEDGGMPERAVETIDGYEEPDAAVRDEKSRRSRPTSKSPKSSPTPSQASMNQDDPWVTGSTKIRNSKKHHFHWLSRMREVKGLAPFQKKDLLDEALDYIFEKYAIE